MQSLREKRSETRKISHNPEVSGSNPLPATKKTIISGRLLIKFWWVSKVHSVFERAIPSPR